MDIDVVENKNAAENGFLSGETIKDPEETKPLKDPPTNNKPEPNPKPVKKSGVPLLLSKISRGSKGDKDKQDPINTNTHNDDPEDPGPSVSDTEDDDSKKMRGKRNRNIRHQGRDHLGIWAHKCRLTPKRGLIYLIFCAAVIFFLLFFLLLLGALWPRGPSNEACSLPKCHAFSSKVLASLNETISPCEDYWEYSCGGWFKENPLPKFKAYWDSASLHEENVKGTIRKILNTVSVDEEPTNSVPLKMKRFYDSCMGLDYINSDKEKELLKIIKGLGGWSVLRDFRAADFDFPRLLRKVHGEFRVPVFFEIDTVPDPSVPSRMVVRIRPSGLSLPHPLYYSEEHKEPMAGAFQTFAKDVVQLLGATSYAGQTFGEQMFNFERRLAEFTPDAMNISLSEVVKLTVGELKSMSNTIFWGDFLSSLFPQGNVNDQTVVVTSSQEYLADVSVLISTTDRPALNNYLIWHLVIKYLPYLSRHYTEALQMFERATKGNLLAPPRWDFCVGETIKFFPHGTDFLLGERRRSNNGHFNGRDPFVSKILNMFELIRQSALNRVSTSTKYGDSLRNYFLDKLRLMTIQIGNPLAGNRSSVEETYLSVQMQKDEFFTNIISLTDYEGRRMQKSLAFPNRDTPVVKAISEAPFEIQFIPSLNKILVPQTVLEKEGLDAPETMDALLYGTIGVEIGEALAKAFGPELGLFLANGAAIPKRDSKVMEMRHIIDSRRSCLSSFFTNIRLDDEPYIERTSLDTTIHLAGIQLALEALRGLQNEQDFQSLPGLDLSPDATFFLAYAQSQCSVHTMLYHDMEHITFSSLSHDHRVRGVLRQMVPFSEAFECSKSSEMYADFTCGNVV